MSISSNSIIHKLFNRQVYGTDRSYKHKHNGQNNVRHFFKKIPDHCNFLLTNIIDDKYRVFNHMFVGLTRCGRFLMSYTELQTDRRHFVYKLQFWVFRMGEKALLVSEILLFEKYDISYILNIEMVQWPNRSDRIAVIGESSRCLDSSVCDSRKIYITVTKFPSLNNCADCHSVANKERNEDFSEYNSKNACLVHGLTVHMSTMMSDISPKLSLSMKYDDHIVFSTKNCIYVLNIDLDQKQVIELDQSEIIYVPIFHKLRCYLTQNGFQMVNKSDSQENIENKRIDTKYYVDRNPYNTNRMGSIFMYKDEILKEEHSAKYIRDSRLEMRLIGNNVAALICNLEGLTFWNHGSNSFVIIDVCPMNGNILIALRISLTTVKYEGQIRNSWHFRNFTTKCVVLWDPASDNCYLEGYCKLLEGSHDEPCKLSLFEIILLRDENLNFFKIPMNHQVWCLKLEFCYRQVNRGPLRYADIRDEENMIAISRN